MRLYVAEKEIQDLIYVLKRKDLQGELVLLKTNKKTKKLFVMLPVLFHVFEIFYNK